MLRLRVLVLALAGALLGSQLAPLQASTAAPCSDVRELQRRGGLVAGLAGVNCPGTQKSDSEPDNRTNNQEPSAPPNRQPAALTPAQLAQQRFQVALSAWRTASAGWERCMGSTIALETDGSRFNSEGTQIVCGNAPTPPEPPPGFTNFSPDAQAGAPQLSPEQLAFAAAARLRLPDPQIGMGPDPSINRWGKAFVGVEYWFWTKGQSALPPVSQTVGPASVRLSAKVEKVTVRAGEDTDVLTCVGAGSAWREGTSLETPSPTCGRRFTTVGERRLVMTATWAVSWEINGATGVIRLDRSTARTVDVSELHSVTR